MELLSFVVVLCLGAGVMAGKYSREVNEPKPSSSDGQTVEFRIAKLNQVWEKANRVGTRTHQSFLRGVSWLSGDLSVWTQDLVSVWAHILSRVSCLPVDAVMEVCLSDFTLFWQMQLSPVRLSELHSDLKIQEKDEMLWKKMKVEGLDDSGEKEAQLRRNFNGETACGR